MPRGPFHGPSASSISGDSSPLPRPLSRSAEASQQPQPGGPGPIQGRGMSRPDLGGPGTGSLNSVEPRGERSWSRVGDGSWAASPQSAAKMEATNNPSPSPVICHHLGPANVHPQPAMPQCPTSCCCLPKTQGPLGTGSQAGLAKSPRAKTALPEDTGRGHSCQLGPRAAPSRPQVP